MSDVDAAAGAQAALESFTTGRGLPVDPTSENKTRRVLELLVAAP